MILYLDTSALVKLLVTEPESPIVAKLTEAAHTVATSQIAYVEACSALARRRRERLLDAETYLHARKTLAEHWLDLAAVELDEIQSGDLTHKHDLRAFDAVHLAAALSLRKNAKHVAIQFCSFDERQRAAAARENLIVLPVAGRSRR